jgi:two-component system osmolarity sensor histidine kinase EnvZ
MSAMSPTHGLRLPRSLFARNVALLVVLVALCQFSSFAVLLHFLQTPRIERTAATFANYVVTLDELLRAAPAATRDELRSKLTVQPDLPAGAALDPPEPGLAVYEHWQRKMFLASLRRHLPSDMPVRWENPHETTGEAGESGDQRLWIRAHLGDAPAWIALPVPEAAHGAGMAAAALLSLGLVAFATVAAYVIQRHLNRPLANLADAARHLSAGGQPEPLPTDGPTEIAQVSDAFNRMTQALQEAEATRALMLAGISHDIRTPLTKLRLAMAMAMSGGGNGAEPGFAASAEGYLDQIDVILQQFLDYAGSGARETPVQGDLNALIASLAADFAGLGHEFELTLGKLAPYPFRPVSMMRMLMNLMQNAVLYGVSGLSVTTWTDAAAGTVCIAVADRGKQLAAEDLDKLKEPFRRGDTARQTKGTGLGLAIVERIARLHGGTLRLRAREGGGMEALVTMPLAQGTESQPAAPLAS